MEEKNGLRRLERERQKTPDQRCLLVKKGWRIYGELTGAAVSGPLAGIVCTKITFVVN